MISFKCNHTRQYERVTAFIKANKTGSYSVYAQREGELPQLVVPAEYTVSNSVPTGKNGGKVAVVKTTPKWLAVVIKKAIIAAQPEDLSSLRCLPLDQLVELTSNDIL